MRRKRVKKVRGSRPLTKHEDDIRRGIRKGPVPPPSRPHKDRRESMIERMWRELKRLGFDE